LGPGRVARLVPGGAQALDEPPREVVAEALGVDEVRLRLVRVEPVALEQGGGAFCGGHLRQGFALYRRAAIFGRVGTRSTIRIHPLPSTPCALHPPGAEDDVHSGLRGGAWGLREPLL